MEAEDGARAGKTIRANPLDVVVIYLTRLPMHGRETADWLRGAKATRGIPIVFIGGQACPERSRRGEALAKTKARAPDAVYTMEEGLAGVLERYSRW